MKYQWKNVVISCCLAALGDPLIKGLTEVANKRPEDPIAYLATYLYNFARNRNSAGNNNRALLESRGEIQVKLPAIYFRKTHYFFRNRRTTVMEFQKSKQNESNRSPLQ